VRATLKLATILVLAATAPVRAGDTRTDMTVHARLEHFSRVYDVHPDLTYVETVTNDTQVLTPRGIHDRDRARRNFSPKTQTLDVVEAWTEEPDGTRMPVAESARFTRPSAAAQNAPGFTSAMTTTVLFPQLREGSRTHIVWRLTQLTPPLLGLNVETMPPTDIPLGEATVSVDAPAALDLHWAARGFAVTERESDGVRRITARLANTQAEPEEPDSVDAEDYAPMFLLTSLSDLKQLGAIYWRQSQTGAAVTPEIAALATRVAGTAAGLEAAQAVYDWVAGNIRYVAVFMDPNDGWVPHEAAEVLRRGYGDCKDHVALMQAMLAALGIQAEPALVYEGGRTTDLPLWVPQFNHVVIYLPQYGLFANPTNPFARFASADRQLAGKTVVLATQQGEVAQIPPERPEDNQYRFDSHITLLRDGTIKGSGQLRTEADLEAGARAAIAQAETPQEVANRVLDGTPEGGFGTFTTSDPRDLTAPFELDATWTSRHGVTLDAASAYFALPTGPDLESPARLRHLLSATARRHALLAGPRDDRWSTTLTLPPGFVVIRLPDEVALHNAVGSYTAHYELAGRDVVVARRLIVERNAIDPDEVPALEDLVYAALDDSRAVLGLGRDEAAVLP
jgi:hypothetical protein